jgi:hypothetical protein
MKSKKVDYKSKRFCHVCKKITPHEPDASTAITYYGKTPHVPWQCTICYPTSLDKLYPKELK